jgi:hypothetical protein
MRVLNKTVQMNEDFEPVLLITLELPLTLNQGFYMKGKNFMDEFYEAIKLYEDKQKEQSDAKD